VLYQPTHYPLDNSVDAREEELEYEVDDIMGHQEVLELDAAKSLIRWKG